MTQGIKRLDHAICENCGSAISLGVNGKDEWTHDDDGRVWCYDEIASPTPKSLISNEQVNGNV